MTDFGFGTLGLADDLATDATRVLRVSMARGLPTAAARPGTPFIAYRVTLVRALREGATGEALLHRIQSWARVTS